MGTLRAQGAGGGSSPPAPPLPCGHVWVCCLFFKHILYALKRTQIV